MTRNITILYGHPDASEERLCYALAKAYQDSAQLTGHAVRRINLSDFNPASVQSSEDFRYGQVPAIVQEAQDAINWADHILFIFPLWMGSMPGQYKMFLEQIFRPGFALDYSKKGFPGKLLKGKSADIVVTMGMPTVAYKGYYFSHGIRNLRRNILYFCGIKPVHLTYFGGVDHVKKKTLKRWMDKMHYLGENPG